MLKEKQSHRFAYFLSIFLLALVLFGEVLPAAGATLPQTPVASRITTPIDNTARVTISKSTHPNAQQQFDRGPVDPGAPMERMILVLGISPEHESQLRTFLDSQQTKGSPDYHHWLTPQEFGQHFGPSQQDIQQVTAWLQQQGFSIGSTAKSGRWIEFNGTAAQVSQAFQTQMRTFEVEGKLHTANSVDITIPAALRPVVQGVASLHNFYSRPMLVRSPAKATGTQLEGKPGITFSGGFHAVTPADFATIYDLNKLYNAIPTALNGTGQTIAVVAVSNINTIGSTGVDDVATFRSLFGLPPSAPNIILNGPDPGVVGGADEATLDVEWSGAVAPNATIDLVVSGGTLTTDPIALSSAFIVDQDLAPIMNVSFGECESVLGTAGNTFWQALWQQAAAQGISVFVSSGDQGAATCAINAPSATAALPPAAVNGFASTQFNTAVGGTEFNEGVGGTSLATFWSTTNSTGGVSALGYIPERVWNDSCTPGKANSLCTGPFANDFIFASGGGGVSTRSGVPSWQMLPITGLSGLTGRGLPDISLNAALHDPYVFCFSTLLTLDCQTSAGSTTFNNFAGGTSFSSPAFAGIMAIVNQEVTVTDPTKIVNGRQGLANYVLYPLAQAESTSGFGPCNSSSLIDPTKRTTCVFNDVTVGNNSVPNVSGFTATAGYDLGTGLGSVDAFNLASQWTTFAGGFQGTTTTVSTTATTPIVITHGTAVPFSVSVARMGMTGTPSGNVSLIAQGGTPAITPVGLIAEPISGSSGTATAGPFNVGNLPGGTTYNVVARYPGDGVFAGSASSSSFTVTVTSETSGTLLTPRIFNVNTNTFSTGSTIAYGDPVNILVIDSSTAGSSGQGTPSGSVAFQDGANALGTVAMDNSGISELADCFLPLNACLTPGQHSITGVYSGDNSFQISTSAAVTITVTAGTPSVSVISPTTIATGIAFTLTAQVNTGFGTIAATGTLQFFDGTTALGSPLTVSGNQASTQVTLNAGGVHNITAQYVSNEPNTYKSATSPPSTVTVASPFNFTATANSQTIAAGATATFNITVNAVGGFTGAVNFNCTGATGSATCTASPNPANLTATTTSVPVTVTVSNTTNAQLAPRPFRTLPWALAAAFAGLLWGVRRKPRQALFMVLAIALIAGAGSCGGKRAPTVDTLTVTGTSGSATNSVILTLTITH